MSEPSALRIVIVGNVSEDLTPEGAWTAGGPALYSARVAAALGADVTLVSRVPADYDRSWFEGLTVKALPAERCSRFENTYPEGGLRRQTLRQAGEPIASVDVPARLTADAVTFIGGRLTVGVGRAPLTPGDGVGMLRGSRYPVYAHASI